ncbi:hypothetical protein RC62_731 [Flavobacterium aquidurense]|uniref:Uncharacterized protein n=1 Tax=Flavobacterium aquidurense TaxID=362413 RepID=A0A0Q0S3M2_9FLAO|nr:hypothetical protein RC62_731 [Flavobacterium aquidurense]
MIILIRQVQLSVLSFFKFKFQIIETENIILKQITPNGFIVIA